MITQFNERWFVLGDISKSSRFFNALDELTNINTNVEIKGMVERNELLFTVGGWFNAAIENIYQTVEMEKSENSSLGNTMGDGFLIIGPPGHGEDHIQYEFADTLYRCKQIKKRAEEILSSSKKNIEKVIVESLHPSYINRKLGSGIDSYLPDLNLKLCIDHGYILTSVGYNRYIGDCINYCARVSSVAFKEASPADLILTDRYFKLLPLDIQKSVSNTFKMDVNIENYYSDNKVDSIWRIPFDKTDFWSVVEKYYKDFCDRKNSDVKLLKDKFLGENKP